MYPPYYDPEKTYDDNYQTGPFGAFADSQELVDEGEPMSLFFDNYVYEPFGIPAGPVINANFVRAAFKKGFDLVTYKTVRTSSHPCHRWPNMIPLDISGDLFLSLAKKGLTQSEGLSFDKGFTNSFGVPSKDPEQWQEDIAKAVSYQRKGQLLIGSFQGTNKGKGRKAFIEDHILGARLMKETGVSVIELNLSCPNEGTTELLCFDVETVREITYQIKNQISNTPLIIKIAYFSDDQNLENFIKAVEKNVDGIAAINTIPALIVNKKGEQALPGEGRLVAGVCGKPIGWAGKEMVKRLDSLRKKMNLSYKIIGVGGIITKDDYLAYREAGADAAMSATGSMWNPYFAKEIKLKEN